jgi:hypothetical protein
MRTARSRNLLASGGNEPVTDAGASGHSVFADAFLNGLRQMPDSFAAAKLFERFVREQVVRRRDFEVASIKLDTSSVPRHNVRPIPGSLHRKRLRPPTHAACVWSPGFPDCRRSEVDRFRRLQH